MSINKPFAPAADQNKESIYDSLSQELTAGDCVLELGSGTGQHLCYFAERSPEIDWQPTDLAHNLPGINAWVEQSGCANIRPPVELDVSMNPWPIKHANVCYTANTLHIISEKDVESLFAGCSSLLAAGGKLCAYGPFQFDGQHVSDSNARFDQMLKSSDSASGVRDVSDLNRLGRVHDFQSARVVTMPVNNFLLIWERLPG